MGGTAMALPRWEREHWLYRNRVFVGRVLDIGGTGDSLGRYRASLPEITHLTVLDHNTCSFEGLDNMILGDASTLPNEQWDCVYSSHCLEHIDHPDRALAEWWDVVRPGGYLVTIVPSWYTYEREVWPPRFNTDHRTSWVMHWRLSQPVHSEAALDLHLALPGATLIRALTLDAGFLPGDYDQTADHVCESAFEIIVRKDGVSF